jgi:hypothetical protein
MQITRRFTREGQDPFAGLNFVPRDSSIRNPSGSIVFEMNDVMVPEKWSQVAIDILAQKYFRRADKLQQSRVTQETKCHRNTLHDNAFRRHRRSVAQVPTSCDRIKEWSLRLGRDGK